MYIHMYTKTLYIMQEDEYVLHVDDQEEQSISITILTKWVNGLHIYGKTKRLQALK